MMADENIPLRHKGCKNTRNDRFKEYYDGANNLIGVVCSFCLYEWTDRDVTIRRHQVRAPRNDDTDEEIQYGDKTFRLLRNQSDEKSVTFVKIDDVTDLTVGDHVRYPWLCGEYHHVIVKAISQQEIRLVHLQGENELNYNEDRVDVSFDVHLKTEVIDEITPDLKKKVDGDIYRCDYGGDGRPDMNDILAIPRANAWRGEKGYRLRKNSCENFISFCKRGNHANFRQDRILVAFFEAIKETFGTEMSRNIKAKAKDTPECDVSDLNDVMLEMDVGIVAIFSWGVSVCFDCSSIYNSVKRDVSKNECMETVLHKVLKSSRDVFDLTDNRTSGCDLTLGLLRQDSSSDSFSVQFGVFCGGKLFYPSDLSSASFLVKSIAKGMSDRYHRSEEVSLITDLRRGDHIVMYKWFLHPRCHMIVTSVDVDRNRINVIRFTYEKGVVEEKVKFKHDINRVIHDDSILFSADEVINRARQDVNRPYSIWSFNCKHFAFFCKTGNIPSEP